MDNKRFYLDDDLPPQYNGHETPEHQNEDEEKDRVPPEYSHSHLSPKQDRQKGPMPKRLSVLQLMKTSVQDTEEGLPKVDSSYFDKKWWHHPQHSAEHLKESNTDAVNSGHDLEKDHSAYNQTNGGDIEIVVSPAEKVRYMLDETEEHLYTPFCQLNVLCHFEEGVTGWKECARWLKYEEKVEAGDRWSKPHVPTTSLHTLFEVREAITEMKCCVWLDLEVSHGCVHQLAERIAEMFQKQKGFTEEQKNAMVEVLLSPNKHKHRKAARKKIHEHSEHCHHNEHHHSGDMKEKVSKLKHVFTKVDDREKSALNYNYPSKINPNQLQEYKPNKKLMGKIPGGTEAANIMVGQVDFLDEPIMALIRLKKAAIIGDMNEVSVPTRFLFVMMGPQDEEIDSHVWEYVEYGRSIACLFIDKIFSEVAYSAQHRQELVDGIDEYIDDLTVLPPSIWDPATRLKPPTHTITIDKIKKRLEGRAAHDHEATHLDQSAEDDHTLKMTGRLFGGMWDDMKRRYPLYLSDIVDGFHPQCFASIIFLYFACITPIVTFGGLLGIATENIMGTMETLLAGAMCGIIYHLFAGQPLTIVGATGPLLIFEGILYRLCIENDIDYLSFRFFCGMWTVLILLIFVAFDLSSLVKYITRFTEESFSVLISLIFIYEAFKKQFHILDTHPINTYYYLNQSEHDCHCEAPSIINTTSSYFTQGRSFNPTSVGPSNMQYTMTTDGTLENTTELFEYMPTSQKVPENLEIFTSIFNWTSLVYEDCVTLSSKVVVTLRCISPENCTDHGWDLTGKGCDDHKITEATPDVFLLSLFLFFGTFGIAYALRIFRTMKFFPSIVRATVSDFAVLIAILICTGIDVAARLDTPKLVVPDKFETTVPGRGWLVNPGKIGSWYLALLAAVPALLATILVFLDQQITGVIVNRKEHKLQKSHGYHLDLFVLAVLIGLCSLLGLPWFVAATVRSITHVRSLLKQSEVRAPGETPQFLGVREQRFTGFFIHILIGVSVFITMILKYVPMSVLYGVFLYMGVTSLNGVQFVDRILILFMPAKFQPDHIYLRHVETYKVHIFTIVQIICMAVMWTVKTINLIAIAFPVTILLLCFIRKAMDFAFTQRELYWLDHIFPESSRKAKEDNKETDDKEEEDSGHKERAKIHHFSKLDGVWHKITHKREYGKAISKRMKSRNIIDRNRKISSYEDPKFTNTDNNKGDLHYRREVTKVMKKITDHNDTSAVYDSKL